MRRRRRERRGSGSKYAMGRHCRVRSTKPPGLPTGRGSAVLRRRDRPRFPFPSAVPSVSSTSRDTAARTCCRSPVAPSSASLLRNSNLSSLPSTSFARPAWDITCEQPRLGAAVAGGQHSPGKNLMATSSLLFRGCWIRTRQCASYVAVRATKISFAFVHRETVPLSSLCVVQVHRAAAVPAEGGRSLLPLHRLRGTLCGQGVGHAAQRRTGQR